MNARNVVLVALAVFGVMALPATVAHALLVKVSINFGPTVTGPDDGTLIVTANPGDTLIITWALGADTSISRYDGLISGVDTMEFTRFGGSALETYTFQPGACLMFPAGACPGTSATEAVSASLRVDAVPEPSTPLLLGSGLAGLAGFGRKFRS